MLTAPLSLAAQQLASTDIYRTQPHPVWVFEPQHSWPQECLTDLWRLQGSSPATAQHTLSETGLLYDPNSAKVKPRLSSIAGANGLASLVLQCLWESFALPVSVKQLVSALGTDHHQPVPQQSSGQPCHLHLHHH